MTPNDFKWLQTTSVDILDTQSPFRSFRAIFKSKGDQIIYTICKHEMLLKIALSFFCTQSEIVQWLKCRYPKFCNKFRTTFIIFETLCGGGKTFGKAISKLLDSCKNFKNRHVKVFKFLLQNFQKNINYIFGQWVSTPILNTEYTRA